MRLVDAHGDSQRFAGTAKTRAAYGSGAEIIQTNRDPHMGVGDANTVGRVEADPAKVLDISFRPGVASVLCDNAVGAVEVASDVPCWNAEGSSGRDKDMGDVLANAAPKRKSLAAVVAA